MSENSGTRARLVKVLKPYHAIPVENRVREGTPDVNFKLGWIECKYLAVWPKSADRAPVKFKHPLLLTQKRWITRRCRVGGLVLLCAQVQTDWFFFDGMLAVEMFGEMTRPEMKDRCLFHMKTMKEKELLAWMETLEISRR